MLITNIILTIRTNPGSIPDDSEWDMHSDIMDTAFMQKDDDGKGP